MGTVIYIYIYIHSEKHPWFKSQNNRVPNSRTEKIQIYRIIGWKK